MKCKIIYWCLLLCMAGASCKKYVDKINPDSLSDPEFWKDENGVRTYNWEFYGMFMGYGNGSATNGDFYFSTFNDDQTPSGFTQYSPTTPSTNGDWSFTFVRKANIMLERIDQVVMSDEAKNHWRGVARMFRGLQYFRLVQTFGGVPWLGRSMDLSDTALIYKPRDSHQLVMDSVLEDINYAIANMRQTDQPNTVNKDVALALKSRICLWEGTYRKYHTEYSLPDADKWLTQAKEASAALIARPYSLEPNYQNIYIADNLSGSKEVILYKRYEPTYLMHSLIAYLYSSTVSSGLNKSAIESYLCVDGRPIGLSPLYQGDDTITTTVANRDKRLKLTIDTNYLYYVGHLKNGLSSASGYRVTKFLPDTNKLKNIQTGINTNITDAPIFYLGEILLNYAEAAAELNQMAKGTFAQSDLDMSINKLRARAGVAAMTLVGFQDPGFTDPKKDADVTSLLWEIRRERRVELMLDGFRLQDLYRWKKGKYMDSNVNPDIFLGAKVPANGSVRRNAAGYIMPYTAAQQRVFTDPKHYLSAVPTNQILLYPAEIQQTMQNTGW